VKKSQQNSDIFLVLEFDEIKTRAFLFDIIGGQYRFISSGASFSTKQFGSGDIRIGAIRAIRQVERNSGYRLFDLSNEEGDRFPQPILEKENIVISVASSQVLKVLPVVTSSMKVDRITNVLECPFPLDFTAPVVPGSIALVEKTLDWILHTAPDVIIIAVGADKGASRSALELIRVVNLACSVFNQREQPAIIYAGNVSIRSQAQEVLEDCINVTYLQNLEPIPGTFDLDSLRRLLSERYLEKLFNTINGIKDLSRISANQISLRAVDFKNVIQFLADSSERTEGVLGMDYRVLENRVEYHAPTGEQYSSSVSLEKLKKKILTDDGKESVIDLLVKEDKQWEMRTLEEYLTNRFEYPAWIPENEIESAFEEALIGVWMDDVAERIRTLGNRSVKIQNLWMNLCLLSGEYFSDQITETDLIWLVLNHIQPCGIMNIILDSSSLLTVVGAAGHANPVLAAQLLDSSVFTHIGTLIAPAGKRRTGTPIMRIDCVMKEEKIFEVEISAGELRQFPVPANKPVDIYLYPYKSIDLGFGQDGLGGKIRITGGKLGLIVDARGRPLHLSGHPKFKHEQFKI
jgi:hypothetical protein